ncbi:hypothetical protein [Nocardia africana]|uniref:hypothetical protein n=1 Tax=Nocardia africana TaxID=134964 RepID=UPI00215D762E|nr:hypothetical protein [Nocardia africana]
MACRRSRIRDRGCLGHRARHRASARRAGAKVALADIDGARLADIAAELAAAGEWSPPWNSM